MKSGRFGDKEDQENSSDRSGDSATNSAGDHHHKVTASSPKRSRKCLQRKVVSIPFKDLESSPSSRNKGEAAPPSDSWTWRKYGQKPIKGSPYPRGYYRCSSSKGCPARKQVERSRVDPTMLVVTYSSDHNHQWPRSSRNNHRHSPNSRQSSPQIAAVYSGDDDGVGVSPIKSEIHEAVVTKKITANDENKFVSLNVAATDDFDGWFGDMGCATMLESPMLAETSSKDTDVSMLFPIMGEEEEYLFADLGELPECSVVFRRREVSTAVGGTQWCGTTS